MVAFSLVVSVTYLALMMKVKTKAIMKIIFAIFRIFSQIHRQAEQKKKSLIK